MTGLHLTSCTTADIAEAHAHRVVAAGELVAELVAALWEARLQIEYLHDKFQETGSGNGVLSQINAALALARARAALARVEGAAPTPPTAAPPELNWLPIATLPDWDNRPWRQFILIDGERTHNGTRWGRKWCGEAFIRKDGPQGYRQEDIDRLLRDGDMDPWGWTVTHWMPAQFPAFPIGGDAP